MSSLELAVWQAMYTDQPRTWRRRITTDVMIIKEDFLGMIEAEWLSKSVLMMRRIHLLCEVWE
jgi:hypothetical protein